MKTALPSIKQMIEKNKKKREQLRKESKRKSEDFKRKLSEY